MFGLHGDPCPWFLFIVYLHLTCRVSAVPFIDGIADRFGVKLKSDFAPVNAFQEDIERPGTFLALQGYALVEFSLDSEPVILVGSPRANGTANGNLSVARFSSMYFFLQVTDKNTSHILIADADNGCIRRVEKFTWDVSTHSGECVVKDWADKKSVDGALADARYVYPFEICTQPGKPKIQHLTDRKSIKVIQADFGTVYTLTRATKMWSTGYFKRIDFSPSNKAYVTSHEDGIFVFNPKTESDISFDFEYKIQPGYSRNNSETKLFFGSTADGSRDWFSIEAITGRFEKFEDLIALSDDLIIASLGGIQLTRSLVLIDLNSADMTLLCISKLVGEVGLRRGLKDACTYRTDGRDIQLINSTIYISGSPSTQDLSSSGVETLNINDYCSMPLSNGSERYRIGVNNSEGVECTLDPLSLDVDWLDGYYSTTFKTDTSTTSTNESRLEEKETPPEVIAIAVCTPVIAMLIVALVVLLFRHKLQALCSTSLCNKRADLRPDSRSTAADSVNLAFKRPLPVVVRVEVGVEEDEYNVIGEGTDYHPYQTADQSNRYADQHGHLYPADDSTPAPRREMDSGAYVTDARLA